MKNRFFYLIIITLIVSACGSPTTQAVTPTNQPPSATVPPTATFTPLPPTNTPEPTATETASPTPTETLTPTPAVFGPANFPAGLNPLTGKPPADPQLLERRPVAAKINLIPRRSFRPPYGLSLADIVYAYYHNDGYSRIHAIFYGNDADLIGPIRSGRMMDGDLVRMYKSIFAYGSADRKVNQRLLNAEFADQLVLEGMQIQCPPTPEAPLCRLSGTGANLMLGSTKALESHVAARGVDVGRQDLSGMSFSNLLPQGGQVANQVYVRYSGDDYARWDYDPGTGRYLRFQDDVYDNANGRDEKYVPLTDKLTEQQITADNVVIIIVRHEYYQQPPAEIVDILLSGTGKAYAVRDGQIYEVLWNRPTLNSVLYLTYPDGTPFPFKPGQTWFQVIGVSSTLSQPAADAWRFEFVFP